MTDQAKPSVADVRKALQENRDRRDAFLNVRNVSDENLAIAAQSFINAQTDGTTIHARETWALEYIRRMEEKGKKDA